MALPYNKRTSFAQGVQEESEEGPQRTPSKATEKPQKSPEEQDAERGDEKKPLDSSKPRTKNLEHKKGWTREFGLRLGLHFGGAELLKLEYTDGDDFTVNAGDGLSLGLELNAVYKFDEVHALAATVGTSILISFLGPEAENGGGTYTRWPVELLLSYRNLSTGLYVAGGAAYHLVAEVDGSGVLEPIDASFSSRLGGVVEVGFRYGAFGFAVRRLFLTYELNSFSFDASSWGITFAWYP